MYEQNKYQINKNKSDYSLGTKIASLITAGAILAYVGLAPELIYAKSRNPQVAKKIEKAAKDVGSTVEEEGKVEKITRNVVGGFTKGIITATESTIEAVTKSAAAKEGNDFWNKYIKNKDQTKLTKQYETFNKDKEETDALEARLKKTGLLDTTYNQAPAKNKETKKKEKQQEKKQEKKDDKSEKKQEKQNPWDAFSNL